MIEITRGTTPTLSCVVPSSIPVSEVDEIWFTIAQNGVIIADKKLSDGTVQVTENIVSIKLSQKESLMLKTYERAECGIQLYRKSDDMRWSLVRPEEIVINRIVKSGEMSAEEV